MPFPHCIYLEDLIMVNHVVFDYLHQRGRNFILTAKNGRHRLFSYYMMSVAFITGVIFSRFSGERRQAQNERSAPDTFLVIL